MTTDEKITEIQRLAHSESKYPDCGNTLEALDCAVKCMKKYGVEENNLKEKAKAKTMYFEYTSEVSDNKVDGSIALVLNGKATDVICCVVGMVKSMVKENPELYPMIEFGLRMCKDECGLTDEQISKEQLAMTMKLLAVMFGGENCSQDEEDEG